MNGRPKVNADRFIDITLDLIAEQGGSLNVNLRQIARKVGCAHTNAYNYFPNYENLLWAAFRRALRRYSDYLVSGLDDGMAPEEYLRRLITNLATYPEEHPGLYRFIGSDPLDLASIPEDIVVTVATMKQWLFDVLNTVAPSGLGQGEVRRISNIVLAYIDGETLNLINGRVVPGEDLHAQVVENAMTILKALGGVNGLPRESFDTYPVLDLK